ncbi:hypothetical protein DHEL01_v206953 [Diaporthe helianthi]|uniref:Uncharacterized protein n=1 Tax=Diaporthe helianthi TaxID=158607 RepID=A0A2P5HWN9_DIAHE|nr:hypothetical protein DHEL01_v206953 [Diaporthe helianthi]
MLAAYDFNPPLLHEFPSSPSGGILSWPSITGDEVSRLASPMVDHMDAMPMDSQSPLSRTLSFGPVEPAFGANNSPLASPVDDGQIHTHQRKIKTLSQNALCEDYYSLLKSELPRWACEGLWLETQVKPLGLLSASPSTKVPVTTASSSYPKLEKAYLAVCQLDTRMGDDVVRNRIALIQLHLEYTQTHEAMRRRNSSSSAGGKTASTVGRGDASQVIDRILESTHGEWDALDQRRRAELRAKFHDRKKYRKHWSQLADALGPGILLVCATRLANAVRSTTVTAKMLEDTIERIKIIDPETMKVIGIHL